MENRHGHDSILLKQQKVFDVIQHMVESQSQEDALTNNFMVVLHRVDNSEGFKK